MRLHTGGADRAFFVPQYRTSVLSCTGHRSMLYAHVCDIAQGCAMSDKRNNGGDFMGPINVLACILILIIFALAKCGGM